MDVNASMESDKAAEVRRDRCAWTLTQNATTTRAEEESGCVPGPDTEHYTNGEMEEVGVGGERQAVEA